MIGSLIKLLAVGSKLKRGFKKKNVITKSNCGSLELSLNEIIAMMFDVWVAVNETRQFQWHRETTYKQDAIEKSIGLLC